MNWEQVEGKWKELKGSAQAQWGKLSDQELDEAKGTRDKLTGLIQEKYGRTKEEAQKEIDEWRKSLS